MNIPMLAIRMQIVHERLPDIISKEKMSNFKLVRLKWLPSPHDNFFIFKILVYRQFEIICFLKTSQNDNFLRNEVLMGGILQYK